MKEVENSIKQKVTAFLTLTKRFVITIAIMLLASINARAYDFEYNGICYKIVSKTNKTASVTYRSEGNADYVSGDITIPAAVAYNGSEYSVIGIGMNSFLNCTELKSVTIPNTVTTISGYAFDNCTGLTSVSIPESVNYISVYVFRSCTALATITIPNSVTSIGTGVFFGCSSLSSVNLGNSLTSIGKRAFFGCTALKSINIPGSVTSIGEEAFSSCGLETLTVAYGESVLNITANVFSETPLETLHIDRNWEGRISTGLKSVTIGNNVTMLPEYAFEWCTGLTAVTIPNSVTTIGLNAFISCSGLTSVTIPSSVSLLGDYAFYLCTKIEEFNVDPNNKVYASVGGVLYTKDLTNLIQYPAGNSRNEFIIPNSVTKITAYAFLKCNNLTSIIIPNTVTTIGKFGFARCDGLTSVTIPNSVKSIEENTFLSCDCLTSITIGTSVTTIANYAFSFCKSLTSLYCQPTTPPIADKDLFNADHFGVDQLINCKLYIPKGFKSEYEKVEPWCNFPNMVEIDFTGIDDVIGDSDDITVSVVNGEIRIDGTDNSIMTEVYAVNGACIYRGSCTRVGNLARGIYVVRVGSKTAKVIL